VKHRLFLFDLNFAEAVHTAHVVRAVHQRNHTTRIRRREAMSALGQKQTSDWRALMSALPPPKADIWQRNTRSGKSATCCGDDETEAGRCCDFNEAHA
jgi:hypothetical protein